MIGVAVMIIVNGVMAGFSYEMRDRLHGVLSDVTLESWSASGFPDAVQHMERIRKVCGDKIASMTPLCQTQGLVSFQLGQEWIHQPVVIVGIDPNGENESKDFGQYFQHPLNREKMSFELREDGYDQSSDPEHPREALKDAGWKYRRTLAPPPDVIREPITNPAAELERLNESQGNVGDRREDLSPSPVPLASSSSQIVPDAPIAGANEPQPQNNDQTPETISAKNPESQNPQAPAHQAEDELKAFPSPHNPDDPEAVRTISGKNPVKVQANYPPSEENNSGTLADGTIDIPELPSDPHAQNEALEAEEARQKQQDFQQVGEPTGSPSHPLSQTPTEQQIQPGGFVSNIENDPVTPPQKDESGSAINDPFNQFRKPENVRIFDPRKEQHTGLIMGISLASIRKPDGEEKFYCWPGKDVKLTMADSSMPPKGITDNFTVVDIYESKMSEFDSQFVFIPMDAMQRLRAMFDPISNKSMVNSIRIKLKNEQDAPLVRDLLREEFNSPDREMYRIQTWQDQRSHILAAVEMERSVMNVLLFLIIAVCGFSIMTIFLMIVSEKVKDIGILRALGASSSGIMLVFLNYGFLLGVVGSALGVVLGFVFLNNINPIADFLSELMQRPVFPPDIYYFYKIPTCVEPQTVSWVIFGTIVVTVLASAFPAWRAASLQPVESLRS